MSPLMIKMAQDKLVLEQKGFYPNPPFPLGDSTVSSIPDTGPKGFPVPKSMDLRHFFVNLENIKHFLYLLDIFSLKWPKSEEFYIFEGGSSVFLKFFL